MGQGASVATAMAQVAPATRVQSMAQELPRTVGAALKKKKKGIMVTSYLGALLTGKGHAGPLGVGDVRSREPAMVLWRMCQASWSCRLGACSPPLRKQARK